MWSGEGRASRYPATDRRRFLSGLAATLVTIPSASRAESGGAVAPPPEAGLPLRLLRAAETPWRLKGDVGSETKLWCYDGTSPGPVLRIRRGEELALTFENALPQPTTVHWHGVRLRNEADGVAGLTQEPLLPGASSTLRFVAPDAGTFWYRPLVPDLAAEQTERGLYGVLVVDEEKPPAVDRDMALVLDDWALTDGGDIRASFGETAEIAYAGRLGNWLTVNGHPPPEQLALPPGGRLRLRLANAANARPFTLRLEGLAAHVVAVDGQPTEPFEPSRRSVSLVPGGRIDLLVSLSAEVGAVGTLVAALGPGLPLMEIATEGSPSALSGTPMVGLPDNDLPDVIALEAARRADLVIEGGLDPAAVPGSRAEMADPARIWRINAVPWTDARATPLLSVRRGSPVVLAFINRTPFLQAMHVHGHSVRLLHALDDGWEPYWLDTVAIPAGQTVRIAFLADNPGRWMIGSSILERLGSGLATWFEVT